METIKHSNYKEVNFNVNYHGESYRITITDSNDHIENMMVFFNGENVAWSVCFDKTASNSMRRVLESHNQTLLYSLTKAQISKAERKNII